MYPTIPLRILLVITRGERGGAQVHVLELAKGLQKQLELQVAIGDNEFLSEELQKLGVRVHIVPELQRSVSPTSDLRALAALRTLIQRVKPNLVHTHSSKAGLLGRLAAKSLGVPVIHTAHAWSFSDGLSLGRKAFSIPIEAAAGRITSRFIVVSEADQEVGTRYHVARMCQTRIVHNGVSDVAERASQHVDAVPIITMVARLAAPKDHVLLLKALAPIQLPFILQLVGDGPDREKLEKLVAELKLAKKVRFLGNSGQVPALLAGSHIFALISRQEGFPLAILEAMRAGLPVIASNVGGIKEAVVHEKTGFLVERHDEEGLRTALTRLLDDIHLRCALGEAGRRSYEAQFTIEQMLSKTRAVYRELAEEHGFSGLMP